MVLLFDFIVSLAGILMVCWIVWLVFGVAGRNNRNKGNMNDKETEQLAELNRMAEAMAERIKTLETLLDADNPEWRDYDEKT